MQMISMNTNGLLQGVLTKELNGRKGLAAQIAATSLVFSRGFNGIINS